MLDDFLNVGGVIHSYLHGVVIGEVDGQLHCGATRVTFFL